MSQKMHYFRSIQGHACRRFGSEAFIGCTRGPKGFTWNTDAVVAIPESEMLRYRKDYNSYIRHGDLKRATKSDYDKWIAKRQAQGKREESEAKAVKIEAAKAAKVEDAKLAKAANDESTNDDSGSDDADKSGTAA